MTATTRSARPALTDLTRPTTAPTTSLTGPPVRPDHRVHFYSSEEWEEFILEYATALAPQYTQIKRLGGPGDHGVDVAGFKTPNGFEGDWDCYQGKHYADPLTVSEAFAEIVKVFVSVDAGHYCLPDHYFFLAPKGCANSLNRLLSKPSALRERFLKDARERAKWIGDLNDGQVARVCELAAGTDFGRFRSIELHEALELHRQTPYHAARFGGPLAPRPQPGSPPEEVSEQESRYIEQLLAVYAERYPGEDIRRENAFSHQQLGDHFRRQRRAFFSAEALRVYARDAVPDGTFEILQRDVYDGVVDIAESFHSSGWERLTKVLSAATQLPLDSHTLISVTHPEDRKGMCHQLVNTGELTWLEVGDADPTE